MNAPPLSSRALAYTDFIWRWLHHSDDQNRIAAMYGSYYDESAIDGSGPVSLVGGLVLNHNQYGNITLDWEVALAYHNFPKKHIHMKDFGRHGDLADYPAGKKWTLFRSLAKAINDNKQFSIHSSLTPSTHKSTWTFLDRRESMSIHAMCFLQAAILQAKWAESEGYEYDIPFMLDKGCPNREDIDLAHAFLTCEFRNRIPDFPAHAGGLTWEDDKKISALQAADVVAWTARRKESGCSFSGGYEPLLSILDPARHIKSHFEDEWMRESGDELRAKLGR